MIKLTENIENTDHCGKEWFRHWFGSLYYDLLYSHRNAEEAELFLSALIAKLQAPSKASILDLACGKGRHSVFLHSLGYEVVGIDLSQASIAHAKTFERDGLHFETADMRYFDLKKKFDCILNLFTSFGYFEKLEDNIRVLEQVKSHLKPGGLFVLDYFNADLVKQTAEQDHSVTKSGIEFKIHKSVQKDFVVKNIIVNDNNCSNQYEERVQLLQFNQLEEMLKTAGLTPIFRFGNYQLETFIPDKSERLIIIARN